MEISFCCVIGTVARFVTLTGEIWTAYAQPGARILAAVHFVKADQSKAQHSGRGGRRFSRDRARQGCTTAATDTDELGVRLQVGQSGNAALCPGKLSTVISRSDYRF